MEIAAPRSLIGVLSRVPARVEAAWYPSSFVELTTNGDSDSMGSLASGAGDATGRGADWANAGLGITSANRLTSQMGNLTDRVALMFFRWGWGGTEGEWSGQPAVNGRLVRSRAGKHWSRLRRSRV